MSLNNVFKNFIKPNNFKLIISSNPNRQNSRKMMQSKDSLEYSHYDTDLKHSKDSFASSPINNLLSSQKAYSSYSSNQKNHKSPAIKISDEERDYSSSHRYKEYEQALQSSKDKDYLENNNEDFYRKSRSNPYKPYEDANNEKSQRYENEESFQKKYRDQLYSSAKKIRDTLEESVDEIEKRINQIEKDINNSMEIPKESKKKIFDKYGTITSNVEKSHKKIKERSPPMTFKEKEERKPKFYQEKFDETGWSIREEKLLREMEALKTENHEIKQNLRVLKRKLEEEEKDKENKKRSESEEEKKPESLEKNEKNEKKIGKNHKELKKATFANSQEFDIEKEIEIL